jgi:hypothetical protein
MLPGIADSFFILTKKKRILTKHRFLDPYHELLRLLTFLVLHWEFLGNFCFAFPIYTDYFRLLAVVGFFGMHLGFILCIRLGFFFWVCTIAYVSNK